MNNRLIKNLEALMLKKHVNGAELALATGIPQPTISRILNGSSQQPRMDTLTKLADYFEISLEELCSGEIINKIPVIEKQFIDQWLREPILNSITQFIPTSKSLSSKSFAIKYEENAPLTYFKQKQMVMIFDPSVQPQDGDIILIKLDQINEIIMRQIIIDVSDKYIKSLNPELHIPGHLNKINNKDIIIATLIQIVMDTK